MNINKAALLCTVGIRLYSSVPVCINIQLKFGIHISVTSL